MKTEVRKGVIPVGGFEDSLEEDRKIKPGKVKAVAWVRGDSEQNAVKMSTGKAR
jgi:hypothetical protein